MLGCRKIQCPDAVNARKKVKKKNLCICQFPLCRWLKLQRDKKGRELDRIGKLERHWNILRKTSRFFCYNLCILSFIYWLLFPTLTAYYSFIFMVQMMFFNEIIDFFFLELFTLRRKVSGFFFFILSKCLPCFLQLEISYKL